MDTAAILRKIKACLALSSSSEPHEAAAALRQAEALMREHKIDIADVHADGATEHISGMGFKRTPPKYAVMLANLVAKAFQCDAIVTAGRIRDVTETMQQDIPALVSFVGVGALPELASYAYEVLLRQLQGARRRYVRTLDKRCKAATRERRSEAFSRGWLAAVLRTVEAFAGRDADAEQAVVAYKAVNYPHATSKRLELARIKASDHVAARAGFAAGKQAQLRQAVGQQDAPKALGAA